MAKTSPELIRAARSLWDRGRTGGKSSDQLSAEQRADLIADSAAVILSLMGRSRSIDNFLRQVCMGIDISSNRP